MNLFTTGVRPIIDDFLLEEAKKTRDYGDYWSASSAGYCMRKNIFDRLGLPHTGEDDPRKQRVFTAGHIFHDWIQELTRKAGVSIAQEVELQDEALMIRGHFDDLILVDGMTHYEDEEQGGVSKQEKHLILYDYKTVNSRSFMWAKKNDNTMSHYHKLQLGTYMYMLRRGSKGLEPNEHTTGYNNGHRTGEPNFFAYPQLEEARILKIEKENLMQMEQQLLWSSDLEKEVLGYWKTLNGYWDKKLIPKCTCEDYEGGFMARDKFNPFYYEDEPCSTKWLAKHKELAEGWKVQP